MRKRAHPGGSANTGDSPGTGTQPIPGQLRLGLRNGVADGWSAAWGKETLADVVGTRTSGPGMFYVLLYIALWTRYRDAVGEPPSSTRQLSIAVGIPNKTLDRYHDRFHAAFPELDDPGALVDAVAPRVEVLPDDDPDVLAFKLGGASMAAPAEGWDQWFEDCTP